MRALRPRSTHSWMPSRDRGSPPRPSPCARPKSPLVNHDPAAVPPTTTAGWRLLALLIAVSSVGPLSVNIILPAIPGLALAFQADPAIVQLTVSLYFGGLGV